MFRTLVFLLLSIPLMAANKVLEFTFVDVEGGQATLIAAPGGESLLIDTGWIGYSQRDAKRIAAAAKKLKLKRIDHVLITHYHTDHVGGAEGLVHEIPVGTFYDHGRNNETDKEAQRLNKGYEAALAVAKHVVVKPGDKIPVKGIEVTVLTANGEMIASPLEGAGQPNPKCGQEKRRDADPSENARSTGVLIAYGKFKFIDLGDLTWNKELDLVCPVNRVGTVDVYLTTHHGMNMSGPAAIVEALHPRVAIMNNGARKGGTPEAWSVIKASPGLEDIWQLHFAMAGGKDHNATDPFIANLDEQCEGKTLRMEATSDGHFTVSNERNKYSKSY